MAEPSLSLQRFAALLELYAREQRPLSSAEVGDAIAAPRSSVAALLKALVQIGWLAHDRRAATYLPTARFAGLGAWVFEQALLSPRLTVALQSLQTETGETVSLSAPADLSLEVIHVIGPDTGIRLVIQVGVRLSLWGTAIGSAYLATIAEPTIRSMYRRAQSSDHPPEVSIRAALAAVRAARDNGGIAFAEGAVIPDVAAISAALPSDVAPRTLVVSVGGPISRIRLRRREIEDAVRRWLDGLDARRGSRPANRLTSDRSRRPERRRA